jgi:glycerol kinase
LSRLPRTTSRFEPAMSNARREELYAGWRDAVSRARSQRTQAEPVS